MAIHPSFPVNQARPTIHWFQQDLRLADNPALIQAAANGPVIPLYILDDETPGRWRMGGASRWWLHHSLEALDRDLRTMGSRLILRRGKAATVLQELIAQTGAGAVLWNRCAEPYARARDAAIAAQLASAAVGTSSFNGALLFEPGQISTTGGGPFKVFTPFWRACLRAPQPVKPLARPVSLAPPGKFPSSDVLGQWRLLPGKPDWSAGLRQNWLAGEAAAAKKLARFVDAGLGKYRRHRDHPGNDVTSLLSPHLHFGEISPRQIWRAIAAAPPDAGGDKFLAELGWREFNHHLLVHFPDLPARNFRADFDGFPWRSDATALCAWQRGRTGYPIVDAGMRQLWQCGWMHNRVRMIAASFLVKDLLIDWRAGQDWFWDTLIDADLANNAAGWQWVAGSGADAAPFFRIFNPVLQGQKFDADGAYVRRWVPELARLDGAYIHNPWLAPTGLLDRAGVRLGVDYPQPVVEHGKARTRALTGFTSLRRQAA